MTILFSQPIEQYPAYLAFASTPSMSNVDANFPASRLVTYDPTEVAKTIVGATSTQIIWNFGSVRTFNLVSLVRTNLSPQAISAIYTSPDGTNWTLIQGNTAIWPNLSGPAAAGPYSEDSDPRKGSVERPSSFFYSATGFSSQYLRIDVNDPGATAGISIGRLFVGRTFKPRLTLQYGSSFSFADSGMADRTDSGSLVMTPGRSIVTAKVKMDFMSSDEMYDYVYEFNYWRQSCREMFCCLDVETIRRLQKNILYCRISDGREVSADDYEAWSHTWSLESI